MPDDIDYAAHALPHVAIEAFKVGAHYEFPNRPQERAPRRADYHAHAVALIQQLAAALGQPPAQAQDQRYPVVGQKRGVIVELETLPPRSDASGPSKTPALDYVPQDIVVLRSERQENRTERAVLFVPDDARAFLTARINSYGAENLGNHRRPDVARFETIEVIRPAPAAALFAGAVDFNSPAPHWWELWVREPAARKPIPRVESVIQAAQQAELTVYPDRLSFPDTEVVFVYGPIAGLQGFLARVPGAVSEVRRATGTIEPFLDLGENGLGQHDWVADLAARIEPPSEGAPTICVLDSGVSAAHPLIEPALVGAWAYNEQWGTDDHHPHGGHGTAVVGTVLHGDLYWRMADQGGVQLTHTAESVKFLPPQGFPPTEPARFGFVTQAAVSMAEIERPNVVRSFCIATSAADFAPDAPSSWSGAIDQISAGSMVGDRQEAHSASEHPKRLVLVSAGNVLGGAKAQVQAHHSIEDPAQSWNALTVGGYTIKDQGPADDPSLTPLAAANERSPFSAGSRNLIGELTPIKPEILFEAGNMVVDQHDICDWHPAVSLLGAGSDVVGEPLVPFWATSAATGVAGNFLGRLKATLPGYWPETYRALLVHSAEWPLPIRRKLIGTGHHWKTGSKADKQLILRDVGYGVPNFSRAVASARSDFTLLAEAVIQPFAIGHGTAVFNEMHFYKLPWPHQALEAMENAVVVMKVTLSYFIEPNLSGRAATRPETYRSYGLRFELKKRTETHDEFQERLSATEEQAGVVPADEEAAEAPQAGVPSEANYWLLGPKAVQAGSLHCDLWRGHAIDLASHDHIAIYPVGGWWKSHLGQGRAADKGRYALAISITAEGQDVDLYTEVQNEVNAHALAAAPVEVAIGGSE